MCVRNHTRVGFVGARCGDQVMGHFYDNTFLHIGRPRPDTEDSIRTLEFWLTMSPGATAGMLTYTVRDVFYTVIQLIFSTDLTWLI